jgi:hypothetical protein
LGWRGLGAALLEIEEAAEGSVVVSLEFGFEVVDGRDTAGAGLVDLLLVADGNAQIVLLRLFVFHSIYHVGDFHAAHAADSPFGVVEGLHFVPFGGTGGVVFGQILVAKLIVFLLRLSGQDDGSGVHPVFQRILR